MRDTGLRMPLNGSRIAATVMALDVPIVTQDDDFPTLAGLNVIRVWPALAALTSAQPVAMVSLTSGPRTGRG